MDSVSATEVAVSKAPCSVTLAVEDAADKLSFKARGFRDLRGEIVFFGDGNLEGDTERLLRRVGGAAESVNDSSRGISNLGGGVMCFFELAGLWIISVESNRARTQSNILYSLDNSKATERGQIRGYRHLQKREDVPRNGEIQTLPAISSSLVSDRDLR